MKNKGVIIVAPVSVMAFVLLLIVMYGWVDTVPLVSGEQGTRFHGTPAGQTNAPVQRSGSPGVQNARFLQPLSPAASPTVQQGMQAAQGGAYMGLMFMDAAVSNLSNQQAGVYVTEVLPGSPARKAGIQPGDRLLRCDHQTISSRRQVGDIIARKMAGDVVKLLVQRGAYKKSYYIRLGKRPAGLLPGPAALQPTLTGAAQ